ncbi:ABC transporter ATP-binding protein [Verrucosispora sp. WMMA2044]|uniref:ABC transporter ATP-binding protein n=1 Tax=Verrucosispora sioxanthis TaxID=2499994 RepID=A0A6M1LCE9_9ACTN|nr:MULTISPECIES: ABC transporter ATP-binding protein [Micromonospora]NEE66787.1 ABC transporter ATP-binding protein [Verrucosispora sioxanthis]NGM15897.1 ABC transporter ATP-binding protein [Verrucosispora sioxanthis]WBB50625.1 ABC transporter ATP-binding protein [Verrucosispora sp. WMMA2044]
MPPQLPHAEPGTPDTRGPLRYIWWLVRCQPWRVLRGGLIGTAWMLGLSLRPYLVARAIDDGLRAADHRTLLWWVAAIVVAGMGLAYLGIMRHRTMTFVREDASARSAAVLLRHLSRIGAVLPRRLAAGEVATVGGADITHTSAVLTMTGPGVGAVLAYVFVAFLLWSVSPSLAVFVLLGVPTVVLLVGPLLRRLERVESVYRHQQGLLTTRAADIVAGLRVLAGVGGRGLFARRYAARSQRLLAEGYRVGAVNSWIESLTIVVPGVFLAAVVWLAARMASAGDITIGQMVAVYGYVAVLIVPVWFLLEGGHQVIRGRVAARRIVALLNLRPDTAGPTSPGGGTRQAPDRPADLHDPASGLTVPAGRLLAVAADDPAEASALADRLGRFVASEVTWDGVPLTSIALDEVRARILVADHDSYLFAGTLREILHVRADLGDADLRAALRTASAEDLLDAHPDGLAMPVGTRARTLSGGQRQRVRLARALLAEPDVLILIDPTSAVDAHTEARIAQRLRAARAGRTTVVLTTSPLLLGRADLVAHLRDGRIVTVGAHVDLLEQDPSYRALVSRDNEPADVDGSLR